MPNHSINIGELSGSIQPHNCPHYSDNDWTALVYIQITKCSSAMQGSQKLSRVPAPTGSLAES